METESSATMHRCLPKSKLSRMRVPMLQKHAASHIQMGNPDFVLTPENKKAPAKRTFTIRSKDVEKQSNHTQQVKQLQRASLQELAEEYQRCQYQIEMIKKRQREKLETIHQKRTRLPTLEPEFPKCPSLETQERINERK